MLIKFANYVGSLLYFSFDIFEKIWINITRVFVNVFVFVFIKVNFETHDDFY